MYPTLPSAANEPPKRLVGWARVSLAPGQSKQTSIPVDRDRLLSDLYIESHGFMPDQIVLDLDATDIPLYGH